MKMFAIVGLTLAALTGLGGCSNNTCRMTCVADSDCQVGQRCLMFGASEPFRCAPVECTDCAGTCEFDYGSCGFVRCVTNP